MTHAHRAVSVFVAGVLLAAAAAQNKKSPQDEADQKEVYNYVLTLDKIQHFGSIIKGLQELEKSHPETKDESEAASLDQIVRKLQKYPDAVALIARNGFSPREFAVCSMTMMQAAMAVGFKKAGTYKEYPPEMLKVVSKVNLDFVEQHWDEIQKATGNLSDKR